MALVEEEMINEKDLSISKDSVEKSNLLKNLILLLLKV